MTVQDESLLTSGFEVAKYCPKCGPGTKLVIRQNMQNKKFFLGCPNWPDCDHTEEIGMEMRMRESGQSTLPGID